MALISHMTAGVGKSNAVMLQWLVAHGLLELFPPMKQQQQQQSTPFVGHLPRGKEATSFTRALFIPRLPYLRAVFLTLLNMSFLLLISQVAIHNSEAIQYCTAYIETVFVKGPNIKGHLATLNPLSRINLTTTTHYDPAGMAAAAIGGRYWRCRYL
jgi:hypothetical protein